MIDYNNYLETNKHKIFKKLIKLEDIQPTDKFELLNIEEYTVKNNQGSVWEMELLLNDSILCFWRMSGSIFEQICRHNKKNNTNIFYIQKDRKVRIGRSYSWLLKISTSPIDNQKEVYTIKEETKDESLEEVNREIKDQQMNPTAKKKFVEMNIDEKKEYIIKVVDAFNKAEVINPKNQIKERPFKNLSLSFTPDNKPAMNNISSFHNLIISGQIKDYSSKLWNKFYDFYYTVYVDFIGDLGVSYNQLEQKQTKTIDGYYETFKTNWKN